MCLRKMVDTTYGIDLPETDMAGVYRHAFPEHSVGKDLQHPWMFHQWTHPLVQRPQNLRKELPAVFRATMETKISATAVAPVQLALSEQMAALQVHHRPHPLPQHISGPPRIRHHGQPGAGEATALRD